jgi:hypothetical protein
MSTSLPNKISGLNFDSEEIKGMIEFVSDIAKENFNIEIPTQLKEDTLYNVVSQYYDHVEAYGVPVKGADCYKFLAWMSIEFYTATSANSTMARDLVISCITAMVTALQLEQRTIPESFVGKMIKMVFNEYGNNKQHIGLGKNGLYISFRCASLVATTDT